MEDHAIIIYHNHKSNVTKDLDIPLDISANDLIVTLNAIFDLEIDTNNVMECYLKSENPVMLLRGNRSLRSFGIHNGTIINITE